MLSEFDIVFTDRDLPHLMGWNKLYTRTTNASNLLKMVETRKLTKDTAKKNSEWFKVKKRILNYNMLSRVFLDRDIETFVATSDMQPNRLKLDVVFVVNNKNESVIVGLRKSQSREFFVPTTLHTENLNNQYNKRRLTKVVGLEWID